MHQLQKLETIFSLFHDADISYAVGDKTKLTLTIECLYLAELIDKSFDKFYIQLNHIDILEFQPWMDDNSKCIFLKVEEIFKYELEILSSVIINDRVRISCNTYFNQGKYSGGNLDISCDEIKVLNQNNEEITINEITKLAKEYWDQFN